MLNFSNLGKHIIAELKYKKSTEIPRPVIIITLLRLSIKLLVFVTAIQFSASPYLLTVLIYVLIFTEIYKNLGTILIVKGGSRFVIGSLVSALDGGIIVLALYFMNLLESDLYLFILLSCALNTIEYGLESAFAEGFVASFAYAIIGLMSGVPNQIIIERFPFILFLGLISGWLSSELKQTEGSLKYVAEDDKQEKKLNRIKSDFISIASNNFRTPLTVLRGYIYILLNKRVGDINKEQEELLNNMDRNVSTMMVLVDDLLRIISLESSKLVLHRENVNARTFFEGMIGDFAVVAKMRNIQFSFDNDISPSISINIDREKIKIALDNIVDNSVKYTKSQLKVKMFSNDKYISIDIEDDGPGISKDDLANLFKKFKTSPSHDPYEIITKSSGLGLYISKVIILAHKGSILVRSDENKGSTFKINIKR